MLDADPPPERWRTSTYSAPGDCVEVALGDDVLVRDSTDPDGPILQFTHTQWRAFMAALERGELEVRGGGTG